MLSGLADAGVSFDFAAVHDAYLPFDYQDAGTPDERAGASLTFRLARRQVGD